ncbi:MAG TPA: ATP-binding cassette domain-containing protein [Tenuifilaceae bacterium]|nr:ATP-binding cassette domain-containing protein [Tenuifilaceae bacterium]HPE17361.1 ATP-binding cassette domain-containing protein [Tenuifilaceae bacterium]HPJ45817.1 ATP-binding cassette domain-containing protein [Tenuifilaceae bacterium]HPQ33533.1 ATP-binding cassette domain-containing protein [Tenuifilaceae bacterium]HRX66835.1 ATP-binding cassette domain-containing protein [Tenuifilaceae bacterium]
MSESILKALMQLFAIIAHPEDDLGDDGTDGDRRVVVESFLRQQLNQDLVREYLKVFDYYYDIHQEKQSEKSKTKKRTSSSSVRVLKICTQINEELTQQQKVVVLVRLLEFVKTEEGTVTEQEMAFISTVAETFFIPENDFYLIHDFVLKSFDELIESDNILVVNDRNEPPKPEIKHIECHSLQGEIRIVRVECANIYFLRYWGNEEVYLNGHLLSKEKVFVLNTGSSIRNPKISPIYYSDIIARFTLDKIKEKILFELKNVEFKFKGGKVGLHRMNFSMESGHLVGIMGASGAGKSTLLNVLNGSEKPSQGQVLVNGIDIHRQSSQIEGLIGFVSQDDLLIEELSVFQNLYYNAKLCFDNYTEEQIVKAVDEMLVSLGLHEIKDMKVGSPLNKKISGGQRKRLNIALELIREPAILFLDEPTSGLSSRDSENILDLLKELTFKGKLVFVVIHQPSSDIFKMFDKLLILDTGGYLIYNGDPIESIIYFKSRVQHANWNESECTLCGNVNPEQVFNIVEANVLDEYGNPTRTRKTSPAEWYEFYNAYNSNDDKEVETPDTLPKNPFKIPNWFKQLKVFVQRDVLSKLANTQYMVINMLESPLLAFLLAYIIKYYNVDVANVHGYTLLENSNIPVYLFMSVIVAFFVGITVSAEEIIKDRKILKRESFLNLSWSSFLMSKVVILLVLSAFQAFIFVLIGNTILEIKGMYLSYWIVLFSTWVSANMLGLLISDSFKAVVTIYILIPFIVIPQIILSGIIVKFEKLNPTISSPSSIPAYGEIIVARWAYEALAVKQFKGNKYQKQFYIYDEAMSKSDYKRNYWLKTLQNKVALCERHLNNPVMSSEIESAINVLKNEIMQEMTSISGSHHPFKQFDQLNSSSLSPELIDNLRTYLEQIRIYYVRLYNKASYQRDSVISSYQQTEKDRENFLKLKRQHFNESLNDFVRNSSEIERIVEYKGRLIQKVDPIYLLPDRKFIKSHFYAPFKQVFGNLFSTFWVNVIVIWVYTILIYIALYYRVVKKGLDFIENHSSKEKE